VPPPPFVLFIKFIKIVANDLHFSNFILVEEIKASVFDNLITKGGQSHPIFNYLGRRLILIPRKAGISRYQNFVKSQQKTIHNLFKLTKCVQIAQIQYNVSNRHMLKRCAQKPTHSLFSKNSKNPPFFCENFKFIPMRH
jgi:hypothetical protein